MEHAFVEPVSSWEYRCVKFCLETGLGMKRQAHDMRKEN